MVQAVVRAEWQRREPRVRLVDVVGTGDDARFGFEVAGADRFAYAVEGPDGLDGFGDGQSPAGTVSRGTLLEMAAGGTTPRAAVALALGWRELLASMGEHLCLLAGREQRRLHVLMRKEVVAALPATATLWQPRCVALGYCDVAANAGGRCRLRPYRPEPDAIRTANVDGRSSARPSSFVWGTNTATGVDSPAVHGVAQEAATP
ncbi:MAG: hypothetical protein HY332_19805 [Chloroflexi bacterium]|nr:hypothetical protein [Chloroflexota bacterium]